ncbi:Uncharacterised protein [Hafnia alvei]|nr:Uncharacterised protein [Hafnia alvei]
MYIVCWFGLVWFGLVWFGLVWFGLVWFGLVWFGLQKLRNTKRNGGSCGITRLRLALRVVASDAQNTDVFCRT